VNDDITFSSSSKGVIEALGSVCDGLTVLEAKYLLTGHEFLEEEDIAQAFDDGRHDLYQYLCVDYLSPQVQSEAILMLEIESVTSDELLHLYLMIRPHFWDHKFIYFGQSTELKAHHFVEMRVASYNLAEFLLVN
jgi:hypothetical protein